MIEEKELNITTEIEHILLSICVITYGHEEYIRKALDSILMQKVNFQYEIIVGEDCSPDGTREILKNYETNYPNTFNMIYREKNMGGRLNSYDLYIRSRGKYIAVLEGDDYWLDPMKLQKQIDFLEANPEFIATAHKVLVVDEFDCAKKEKYPSYSESIYTLHHFQKGLLPGQTGSIVRRNYHKEYSFDYSLINQPDLSPGDQINAMILASLGPVFCFSENMSAYRHVTSGGTSYSAGNRRRTPQQMLFFWTAMVEFSRTQTKNSSMIEYLEKKQLYASLRCFGKISLKELIYIYKGINSKLKAIKYVLTELIIWPVNKITKNITRRLNGDF